MSLNDAYNWAIQKCNDDTNLYSQEYREEQTVGGYTYYDCSSFIWYALKYAGFDVVSAHGGQNWAFTTSDMESALLALGFTEVPINGQWLAGDIVWRSGHCEFVYSGGNGQGITMGAHSSTYSVPNQISINTSPSQASSYTKLYRYGTRGLGYSMYVVAATCGNWWQESNINPAIWEHLQVGSPGYGLGQWTDNANTNRKTQLFNWLDAHGYSRTDGNAQLEYFVEENVWYRGGSQTQYADPYASLSAFLNSTSTDLTTLTYAFMQGWEGIWDGTQNTRVQEANTVYQYLLQHGNDNVTWISGNRYLSQAEILNNAVMVWKYLGRGITPPHPVHKIKLPIYMMIRRRRRNGY